MTGGVPSFPLLGPSPFLRMKAALCWGRVSQTLSWAPSLGAHLGFDQLVIWVLVQKPKRAPRGAPRPTVLGCLLLLGRERQVLPCLRCHPHTREQETDSTIRCYFRIKDMLANVYILSSFAESKHAAEDNIPKYRILERSSISQVPSKSRSSLKLSFG